MSTKKTCEAERVMVNPTPALRDAIKAVQEGSASSKSTARCDLDFQDGSCLVVTSCHGADAVCEVVYPPPPAAPCEGTAQKA